MEIKIIKPCIVDGESVKPSKKTMNVTDKTGKILVGLGLAEDLTPRAEPLELNLTLDPQLLKKAEEEIAALKEEIRAKDEIIASLTKEAGK